MQNDSQPKSKPDSKPDPKPLSDADRQKLRRERRVEARDLLASAIAGGDGAACAAAALVNNGTHWLGQVAKLVDVEIGEDGEISVKPFFLDGREVVSNYRLWRVPKRERPRCGARCRDGHSCLAAVTVASDGSFTARCRMHGGASPLALKGALKSEWERELEKECARVSPKSIEDWSAVTEALLARGLVPEE